MSDAVSTRFAPGHAKTGGRAKGTPNRDRQVSIRRILEEADPIGLLIAAARGEPMMLAVEPGGEPTLIYPTYKDVLTARMKLADKVMPDLRSVEVAGAGNMVLVNLRLAGELAAPDGQDALRLEDRAA